MNLQKFRHKNNEVKGIISHINGSKVLIKIPGMYYEIRVEHKGLPLKLHDNISGILEKYAGITVLTQIKK